MARPWHDEADLIVVGASVAGLAAAVIAADRGARTIVLERTKVLGGGAGSEAELIAAAGSRFQQDAGISDDPTRLADDILTASGQAAEPAVVQAVAAQGAALIAWLADRCGVPIALVRGRTPAGHSVARLHTPGERGGARLIAEL